MKRNGFRSFSKRLPSVYYCTPYNVYNNIPCYCDIYATARDRSLVGATAAVQYICISWKTIARTTAARITPRCPDARKWRRRKITLLKVTGTVDIVFFFSFLNGYRSYYAFRIERYYTPRRRYIILIIFEVVRRRWPPNVRNTFSTTSPIFNLCRSIAGNVWTGTITLTQALSISTHANLTDIIQIQRVK